MKISDLKPGQKVRLSNFGKVEKRVFQCEGINIYKYYSLNEGSKTLKSEKIRLL